MSEGRRHRSVNWRSLMVAATLSAVAIPAMQQTSAHAQAVHASPALLRTAASHPHRMLKVIVQKRGLTTIPEGLITSAGGKITKNLSIIDAVAATVPASAIKQIASSNSVNWMSPDAMVHRSQWGPDGWLGTSNLLNSYNIAAGASHLWSSRYQGGGVNVAVVDSGVTPNSDLSGRLVAAVSVKANDPTTTDAFGHGTHVAGIIAGNGSLSNSQYIGMAPKAGIVSVKVFDSTGAGTVSDVVNGLQWVYNNRNAYNIKVVNLSLDSTVAQSYNNDPLDAACEILWFNKIVVVAAAGNNGTTNPGTLYSPANDPFVITVGSVADNGTATTSDDALNSFSAYGTTVDGFSKPDVVAPGTDIVSDLASPTDALALAHPSHINGANYFDMSGTSMSAAAVSGAAALLLEYDSSLTPDQVKQRLMTTATKQLASTTGIGAGEINVYQAAYNGNNNSANTGIKPSAALQTGTGTGFVTWDSASWGSASWGSASWGSASWGSASWGSASWGSDYWGKTKKHPLGTNDKSDNDPRVNG